MIEKLGFDLKSKFHIIFKTYTDKKQFEISLGKNPEDYENIRKETNSYEQKPVTTDDFNEVEEKEVKEHVENQNIPQKLKTELKKWGLQMIKLKPPSTIFRC